MRKFVIVCAVLLPLGCTTSAPQRTTGPVPLARGDAASFSPMVSPTSTGPRCIEASDEDVAAGRRALAVRYAGPPARQVTVTLDADGVPTRYMDVRGDLEGSGDDAGDRTTIGLYLEQGYAVLSNRSRGSDPTMLEVPVEEVLTSASLGDPSAVIDGVLESCDGVAPARVRDPA